MLPWQRLMRQLTIKTPKFCVVNLLAAIFRLRILVFSLLKSEPKSEVQSPTYTQKMLFSE